MRAPRTYRLKNEITHIQEHYNSLTERAIRVFNEQKNHCKEILLSMISELEDIVNTSEIRGYLHELSVFISSIVENDPVFAVCRTDNIFQWILQILLLSDPGFVSKLTGTKTYQDKLQQLMERIQGERSEVFNRKENNVSKLLIISIPLLIELILCPYKMYQVQLK
jgi:hypothetical protein